MSAKMTSDDKKKLARKKILEGIKIYFPEEALVLLKNERFLYETHKTLTHDQVSQGVFALRMALHILHSGNSGGRDLHALNELYLLNPEATLAFNKVLVSFGRTPNGEVALD